MEFKDYYKIMGLEPDASAEDIKRAYKKLARKYHPDVSDEPDAQKKFQEIGEAYDILKDPEKRAEYDQLRTYAHQGGRQRQTAGGGHSFTFDESEFEGTDFEDLLKSIFGERAGGGFDTGGFRDFGFGGARQRHRRGGDLRYRLVVTAEEAYSGGSRQISLADPHSGEERKINVKIPKGITHGKELRLKGQGQPGTEAGLEGDLYLEIEIAPHPVFELEGRNVTLMLPVAPWEAALGANVEVPTLGGHVNLKIPENSQSGKRLRLKGRGLPGNPAGDQFVILKIVNPEVRTEEDRQAFRDMKARLDFDPRRNLKEARHG